MLTKVLSDENRQKFSTKGLSSEVDKSSERQESPKVQCDKKSTNVLSARKSAKVLSDGKPAKVLSAKRQESSE